MNNSEITFENVSFKYPKQKSLENSLANLVKKIFKSKSKLSDPDFALMQLNFTIRSGEVVGVIGRNGAGKSTLLKLLSGIYIPTSGSARVVGRISPLIELGAGFSPDFSARENIEMYATLLGNHLDQVRQGIPEIMAWAELSEYTDTPIRKFSTGMTGRVAFSAATHFKSEIVLIDEILSVGDEKFRTKSQERIAKILNSGAIVLVVSHDMETVRELAPRSIVIKKGRIVFDGPTDQAIKIYKDQD
jgi:ABC-2 type transport system ATP-binding protein